MKYLLLQFWYTTFFLCNNKKVMIIGVTKWPNSADDIMKHYSLGFLIIVTDERIYSKHNNDGDKSVITQVFLNVFVFLGSKFRSYFYHYYLNFLWPIPAHVFNYYHVIYINFWIIIWHKMNFLFWVARYGSWKDLGILMLFFSWELLLGLQIFQLLLNFYIGMLKLCKCEIWWKINTRMLLMPILVKVLKYSFCLQR